MVRLSVCLVTLVGCAVDGEPDLDYTRHRVTVGDHVGTGCSTSVVIGLSKQIGEQASCLAPEMLTSFEAGGGISFGAAVLPFLDPGAKDDLLAAVAAKGGQLNINSGYRTVVQQYLLYRWYQQGRCGIPVAATPGRSNHESGRALDIGNYGEWVGTLRSYGWEQTVPGDAVHFDHLASPDNRGLDVLAFQILWNMNNPQDLIAEDGLYGPQTGDRLSNSPPDGFPISGCADPGAALAAEIAGSKLPDSIAPGGLGVVSLEVSNTGTDTWAAGTVELVPSQPLGRDSEFYDPDSWASPSRVYTLDSSVEPGESVTVVFDLLVPDTIEEGTVIVESFSLVKDGEEFGPTIVVDVEVRPTTDIEGEAPQDPQLVGGCSTGGSGPTSSPLWLLTLVALLRRRRYASSSS